MDFQGIIYIVAFFFIYSFFGWVLESITKTIAQKKPVNSGFLFGPFCPIYGIGAVGMSLILKSFEGNYILTFIVGFIVFTIWEYFVGWLLEKVFHTKYWDYSYYKFNYKGRICLVNSLTWGVLGVAFTELIHPTVSYVINLVKPVEIINITTLIFTIYIIIDFVITAAKVKNINVSLSRLGEITSSLKEKIDELKNVPEKAKKREKIKLAIEELKQKQEDLKNKIEKQTQRFRNAFPNMKINELIKKKLELRKERRNNTKEP